jgi:CRISPR-associated protein Csd1
MDEIIAGIPSYPARLTIEQQGLFSLGYYHQRAADRAEAKLRREAKIETEVRVETTD